METEMSLMNTVSALGWVDPRAVSLGVRVKQLGSWVGRSPPEWVN